MTDSSSLPHDVLAKALKDLARVDYDLSKERDMELAATQVATLLEDPATASLLLEKIEQYSKDDTDPIELARKPTLPFPTLMVTPGPQDDLHTDLASVSESAAPIPKHSWFTWEALPTKLRLKLKATPLAERGELLPGHYNEFLSSSHTIIWHSFLSAAVQSLTESVQNEQHVVPGTTSHLGTLRSITTRTGPSSGRILIFQNNLRCTVAFEANENLMYLIIHQPGAGKTERMVKLANGPTIFGAELVDAFDGQAELAGLTMESLQAAIDGADGSTVYQH